jgi:hypothetical protein
MPATPNTPAGPSGSPGAAGSPGGGHRHLGHGRRQRSGAAPHGPPDVGALAREAVIGFLHDASTATAEREAVRAAGGEDIVTAAPRTMVVAEPEVVPWDAVSAGSDAGGESEAWRAAAISVAALDRIEAAAAKVEADIAVAFRAYAELQAGAGAAAEAAVHAAQSAMAAAGQAVEAERQVRISLRQVRQYVVVTGVLVAIVIIVLAVATSPVH